MGCTVREKPIRPNRRTRPVANRSPPDGTKLSYYNMPLTALSENPIIVHNPDPMNSVFDDSGWGYCTEEQLEEILMKNLEFLYNDAINKLMDEGYSEEVSLKAILRNGHCYGGMDVFTNIYHNSLAYLKSVGSDGEEPGLGFTDMKQLMEYSLAGMVSLMQQIKPNLSKGDAMWLLLMCDLHVGRASVMELPDLPSHGVNKNVSANVSNGGAVGAVPALCRFHSGWGFGNDETSMKGFISYATEMSLQREIVCPKRFNLSPSLQNMLKRNVAMFAAGFRANSKHFQSQSQSSPSSVEVPVVQKEVSQYAKNLEVVNAMMSKFQDLNLGGNSEKKALDQKDKRVLSLVNHIKDLEKQKKERREWAEKKALQAAIKLSNDLTELKMLRMEREDIQGPKKGKPTLDDSTMKRLTEMENSLRKASGQVDRANAAVRKLEIENSEIRAEMEAFKLSASESVAMCLETAKREKKCLKKLLAGEKQKTKIQEDIEAERQNLIEAQKELDEVEAARKDAEAKWRQEQKSKELVLAQLEEERHLKEVSETNNKRKLEALRLKIEINFQRHKDDVQRLEQEYTLLKNSAESNETEHQSNSNHIWMGNSNEGAHQDETIVRLLHELDLEDSIADKDVGCDRKCMICMNEEVSVVFLPCAHQVICASCDDNFGKKGKATCPYCRVPIEQRIRVYGASS